MAFVGQCGKLTFPRDGIRLYAIYGKLGKANESCHWLTLAFGKWAIRTVGVAAWATRWRLIVDSPWQDDGTGLSERYGLRMPLHSGRARHGHAPTAEMW